MKKILLIMTVLVLSACSLGMSTTPKQKVSEFLDKYKKQDETILSQLEETIKSEYTKDDYRDRYKNLMTNQYKNMEYTLKDEIIDGDNAVVEAEITVYDYGSSIRKANEYLNSNPDKFKKEDKTTIDEEDSDDETTDESKLDSGLLGNYDEDKFIDYKLSEMEKVTDTVTYTIEFTLTKVDNEWQIDALSNSDIQKLHGIYISED